MTVAELARQGFALGYAEFGQFPIDQRVQASCLTIQESAGRYDHPGTMRLIVESGRIEGHRAKREGQHKRLYRYHAKELGGLLATVMHRVDGPELSARIGAYAAAQTGAGNGPVLRRRAVAGIALAAITAQVHPTDRQALDALNGAGWAHATAYGIAEANVTPTKGGPPDTAKTAAAAAAALALISTTDATAIASAWTDMELNSLAMGAAMAAGDGAELGAATRAVKSALVDTGQATSTYADQLHRAVMQAFVDRTQVLSGVQVLYNYVTDGNPCGVCISNEEGSPYLSSDLPGIPQHPHCLCDYERSSQTLPAAQPADG